jgi:hypothetical protein
VDRAVDRPLGGPLRLWQFQPAQAADDTVTFTGLAQDLGQLQASRRDSQSNFWASLRSLGQPCGFQADGDGGKATDAEWLMDPSLQTLHLLDHELREQHAPEVCTSIHI